MVCRKRLLNSEARRMKSFAGISFALAYVRNSLLVCLPCCPDRGVMYESVDSTGNVRLKTILPQSNVKTSL